MTHLRGKALSPTAALPLLSPPCFAAHVLLLRLSAQPQSDKPPPADLHILPDRRLRARRRRSLIAALPNRVSAENEITESRGRQEPTDSQNLCRSTSKHNDSVPAEEPRRVRTNAPCPCRLSSGAETSAADATAWSHPPGSRNAEGSLPDASKWMHVSPAASCPWASRAKNPPPEKLLRALHLALHLSPRQADRRTPFGALPHFDKTPRSAARGPAVTPAVAAPSFRSDLAPESATDRSVQP